MANLLQDFETYFTTMGVITAGAFYKNTMLDTPDSAAAVYEYQGSVGLPQIASALRSIQIVARDKTDAGARAQINLLYNSLVTDDGILDLAPLRWSMIALRQPPFKMKVDTAGRTYYCFNVGVTTYTD